MKQIKIINKLPTPADMIESNTEKLFKPKLSKFLSLSFVFICASGWPLILLAIFAS